MGCLQQQRAGSRRRACRGPQVRPATCPATLRRRGFPPRVGRTRRALLNNCCAAQAGWQEGCGRAASPSLDRATMLPPLLPLGRGRDSHAGRRGSIQAASSAPGGKPEPYNHLRWANLGACGVHRRLVFLQGMQSPGSIMNVIPAAAHRHRRRRACMGCAPREPAASCPRCPLPVLVEAAVQTQPGQLHTLAHSLMHPIPPSLQLAQSGAV